MSYFVSRIEQDSEFWLSALIVCHSLSLLQQCNVLNFFQKNKSYTLKMEIDEIDSKDGHIYRLTKIYEI